MKALIIYRVDIANVSNRGVSKKMQGHLYGFLENGFEVDVVYQSGDGLFLNETKISYFPEVGFRNKLFKTREFYNVIVQNIDASKYDVILIRFHLIMPAFIKMLEQFRNANPKVRIVIDLPTYPYYREWNGLLGKVLLQVDRVFRSRLKDKVDLLLHYGNDEKLFGIRCLNVSNGILPKQVRITPKVNQEKVNLLAVGKWAYWHGLDRLIKTIKKERRVILNIVGEGPANAYLRKEAENASNIIFHGNLSGEALENEYRKANIGIGTLGIHRKALKIDSSLKHRDYCMMGLPFILSTKDIDFPGNLDFVHYVEPSETSINIEEILTFYKGMQSKVGIENVMIKYARENLGWGLKVRQVLNELSNH